MNCPTCDQSLPVDRDCAGPGCDKYLEGSQVKYCGPACRNRANVAAYRARAKAVDSPTVGA